MTRGWKIAEEHFRVLREFGKDAAARQLPDRQKRQVWEATLATAKLAYVPMEAVRQRYLLFLQGRAKESGISVGIDADPSLVRVALTWQGKTLAAHVMPVRSLMLAVLPGWFANFDTYEESLAELLDLLEAMNKTRAKKKPKGPS